MSRVPPNCRRRWIVRSLPTVLVVVVGVPLLAGALLGSFGPSPAPDGPLTCRAERQVYLHEITARGELESAKNVEVRCEVHAGDRQWLRILEVVAEGTHVQPGDFLVRLDSSALEDELSRQKILCEQSKAAVAAARSAYENVQGAVDRYLQGEYVVLRQDAESKLTVARYRQSRAREYLEASRKLEAQGFITAQQLQADEFALKAADTDVRLAEVRVSVLEDYTKPKQVKDLQCALVTRKAKLAAAEFKCKLEFQQLAEIEDQIRKCVVRAPVAGQVVLAHLHHNGHSHMVEPGEMVFERRVLVRLPDPARMQVKALVEEEKIAVVRPGLPVGVRLEAFPGMELIGRVVKLSDFPEPEMGHDPVAVKQYEATVQIDGGPEDLRPGLSAEVRIGVQRLDRALQVPCQAVFRHGEKSYCLRVRGSRIQPCEVTLGPTNGTTVVVRGGLKEGQEVVLAAAAHREKIVLPELAAEPYTPGPLAQANLTTPAGLP